MVESRKQQQSVALSSAGARCMAVSDHAKEIIFLRTLLCNLGFAQDNSHNTTIVRIEWTTSSVAAGQAHRHPQALHA